MNDFYKSPYFMMFIIGVVNTSLLIIYDIKYMIYLFLLFLILKKIKYLHIILIEK